MIQMLLVWLASGRFVDMVSARYHSSYLTRHRLSTIVRRVRLVAIAFSVFTLLWIPLDIAALAPDQWQLMAVCRIVAAIVFLLLAIAPDWEQSRARTLAMLGIALLMPMMIYGVSQYLLAGASLHDRTERRLSRRHRAGARRERDPGVQVETPATWPLNLYEAEAPGRSAPRHAQRLLA